MTQTLSDLDTEVLNALDFDVEHVCESGACQDVGRGSHPAHWLWESECACAIIEVCEARRILEYVIFARSGGRTCLDCGVATHSPGNFLPLK